MEQISKSYCCVGLMSGTSLDGLDLVLCELNPEETHWSYRILKAETTTYNNRWKQRLREAPRLGGYELMKLHRQYGDFLGEQVNLFLKDVARQPDFIASHGHTVFHRPDEKVSLQIGDGAMLAARTGLTTVSDFRTLDITLGGQGAPLVPIGDHLLFSDYQACVNLGGFANLSCERDGQCVAWDICPVNFVVNRLISQMGKEFDEDGVVGRGGIVIPTLLEELNALAYYHRPAPKSLGEEWVNGEFLPLLAEYNDYPIPDLIRTCYEHASDQIADNLNGIGDGSFLFTGGGTYNRFLMQLVSEKTKGHIVIPDSQLIDFKEALVFALLGILRLEHRVNCLASVTGARCDSCSGVIHRV